MGCFSIPKNKSKVAAASQQAEHQQQQHHPQQHHPHPHQPNSNSFYHGSKLEQLLSSGVSSNKPVMLPDPDDIPGGQPPGAGPIPTPTSIRGGGKHNKGAKERAGSPIITSSGTHLKNSAGRLSNHRPRAMSAPFNSYNSYPPSSEDHRRALQGSQSDHNNRVIPFSAPLPSRPSTLDGNSSPMSPHTATAGPSNGSPLHVLLASASVAEAVSRGAQVGLDLRVAKAFTDRKSGLFTGRPTRLPKPQPAAAHPLPLPNPPELDEDAVTGLPAGFTNCHVSSSSVSPSPSRGKEGFGPSSYGFRPMGGGGGGGGAGGGGGGGGGTNPAEAMPLPPPALPTHSRTPVRAFPFSELAPSLVPECFLGEGVFGRAYRAWVDFDGENSIEKKIEVAVVCPMVKSMQGLKEWMAEVNWLARLQNPNLCRLIGYSAEDASGPGNRRLLVYEFMNNGSLDMFIRLTENTSVLDWSTRMRIALDVAQGLAYLHDKAPFQVICRDLSAPSIQLDKDFRAKLSGFGLARCGPEGDQGLLMVGPYVAPESGRNGLVTIKSNAWSFGVILLELLTGRRHMDASFPSGQQNLIQMTKPFLRDEGKLFLIMDPELNGRYSGRGALKVANIAFQCLINEASLRPNLSEAVDVLKTVQIDEEALSWDLRKSRSLGQSVGSPVTYSRSASDHFVQRAFNSNSLTSSPSHNVGKQQDREFVKSVGGLPSLGSVISSPSYVESRLSIDKPPKSVYIDGQKLPSPVQQQQQQQQQQQSFESRQMHGDNDVKQRRASSGGASSASLSSDPKRPTGEVTKLQAPNLTGLMQNGEIKQQQAGQPDDLQFQTRVHPQETSTSSEANKLQGQGRETTKFQAPQTMFSSQYSEFLQISPEGGRKLPVPDFSSRRPRSCELKPSPEGAWKGLSRQSSLSSRSRSGEQQKVRISDARKLPVPQSNGELKQQKQQKQQQQSLEGRYMGSRSLSGEIRQQPYASAARKLSPAASHLMESTQPSSKDREFQKFPFDNNHRQLNGMEEQETHKSMSQSSASSRLSCAPALSFDPPMIREEFCVW
ncbi:unnamed protein product [Calypogeia fissa]